MKKEINSNKFKVSKPVIIVTFFLFLILIVIELLSIIMVQDIVLGKFTTTGNGTSLYGAGFIDVTIKKWGYVIFAAFVIISAIRALIKSKKNKFRILIIC